MDCRCHKQVGKHYTKLKMKKIIFLFGLIAICLAGFSQETGTFTDPRDNKVYKTVTINGQTWMAENLVFKAKSGCWAYDNNENNVATYGYLYTLTTAKKSCPVGWHVPSNVEWFILTDYLGDENSGGKLKEIGLTHWKSPNEGANNETGFTALPGGYHFTGKTFAYLGYAGYWWTSSKGENGYTYKIISTTNANKNKVADASNSPKLGVSVRCVKD